MHKIVIFGSSGCTPDSEEYIKAFELGKALARCGISVVTGGYSGTMEAVSCGASQVGGVKVYIVLPGSVGTLGELVLVWNHINIDFRVNSRSRKHLICFREPWERFVLHTHDILTLTDKDLKHIHFIDSVNEAVALAKDFLSTETVE